MSEYLTVSRLNQYIKSVVESDFSLMNIALIGEVSSLTRHYTGHFYFTLKDETSQIRCMMFSSYAARLKFQFRNGDQILVRGYVGVYDKGGVYQFYCRDAEAYGEGQYLLFLSRLKEKLQAEGLFDRPKKPLPLLPRKVGLITARSGAAVHDFFSTMNRRIRAETYLFPSLVQGEGAPASLIQAIAASRMFDLDVLVITRGGGSKEDLRCFNDESLIRFASEGSVPLVTAVGHQIDTTLIDYIADARCITPTDAATRVFASREELTAKIHQDMKRIAFAAQQRMNRTAEYLMMLSKALEAHAPGRILQAHQTAVRDAMKRIESALKASKEKKQAALYQLQARLCAAERAKVQAAWMRCSIAKEKIAYLDPRGLLKRGYSIVEDASGAPIRTVAELKRQQSITIRLADGRVRAKIAETEELYDI